jgi:hypothetical protein
MFPLCERMRETLPSFLYSTGGARGGRDIAGFWSENTADDIVLLAKALWWILERKEGKTEESMLAKVRSRSGHVITSSLHIARVWEYFSPNRVTRVMRIIAAAAIEKRKPMTRHCTTSTFRKPLIIG